MKNTGQDCALVNVSIIFLHRFSGRALAIMFNSSLTDGGYFDVCYVQCDTCVILVLHVRYQRVFNHMAASTVLLHTHALNSTFITNTLLRSYCRKKSIFSYAKENQYCSHTFHLHAKHNETTPACGPDV